MTIKEVSILIGILKAEIEAGIDVEFNIEWIRELNKSILKAIE